MHLKLLVDAASNAILGAPAIGGAGVDERIDVLATAILGSAPHRREPAYAPRYGSAKDVINRPGDVADSLAAGTPENVPWHGLDSALGAGEVLVEVGSPAEFASGNIPGPRNVPLDDLRMRLGEPPAPPPHRAWSGRAAWPHGRADAPSARIRRAESRRRVPDLDRKNLRGRPGREAL